MDNPQRFLRFKDTALKEFHFLESLGFRVAETNETDVRYAGPTADLEVFHGRQSYEIGVNVVHQGDRYSLEEIRNLQSLQCGDAADFRKFAATDAHGIEVGVARVASACRECLQIILNDDPAIYRELQKLREAHGRELALASLISQVRPKADEAFRAKNYRQAAELYESIREGLSPAELRRLEIAKSRR
jgi:hypothetical protein